jgi:hypothetical protein
MVAEWPFSASSKTAEAGKREFAELGGLLSYGWMAAEFARNAACPSRKPVVLDIVDFVLP